MKKLILLLIIVFGLSGCSNNENILEEFKVTANEDKLFGAIICSEKQTIQIDNISTSKVLKTNGEYVNKGDTLISIYDDNIQKEIDLYKFKISEINNQIENKKNQIIELHNKENLQIEKIEYESKIGALETEIENFSNNLREYQFSLSQLKSNKKHIAKFDGQFLINDNLINVISNNKNIEIIVSEDEYSTLKLEKNYNIYKKNGEMIGLGKPNSVVPYSEKTDQGKIAYYKVMFPLMLSDKNCKILENETVYIVLNEKEFLIPQEYIYERNNKNFVCKNNKLYEVKGKKFKEYYSVSEGLSEGDIIMDFKGVIDD